MKFPVTYFSQLFLLVTVWPTLAVVSCISFTLTVYDRIPLGNAKIKLCAFISIPVIAASLFFHTETHESKYSVDSTPRFRKTVIAVKSVLLTLQQQHAYDGFCSLRYSITNNTDAAQSALRFHCLVFGGEEFAFREVSIPHLDPHGSTNLIVFVYARGLSKDNTHNVKTSPAYKASPSE